MSQEGVDAFTIYVALRKVTPVEGQTTMPFFVHVGGRSGSVKGAAAYCFMSNLVERLM